MKTGRLTRAALMAVLTLAAGFIRIPAGPVPVTLQTLFVFMTGL
ncbi:MAG TPA: biotin transporter BioY, partial [Clostridiaceae bacterium]|nr:biotin transporter BioY [Clostridiaceae bacterium]